MMQVSKRILSGSFVFAALAFVATAALTGCAVEPGSWSYYGHYHGYANEGHGYPVEWQHDPNSPTTTTLEYQPPELLAQNEIDQAKKENRPADLSQIPPGGRVKLHLHGHDRHAANPKNYDFTVADQNGQVIKHETGPNKPAPLPANSKAGPPSYEGYHTIDLPTPVKGPVQVNVVNKMDNSHEQYTIRHPSASSPAATSAPAKNLPPGARPRLTQ